MKENRKEIVNLKGVLTPWEKMYFVDYNNLSFYKEKNHSVGTLNTSKREYKEALVGRCNSLLYIQ